MIMHVTKSSDGSWQKNGKLLSFFSINRWFKAKGFSVKIGAYMIGFMW